MVMHIVTRTSDVGLAREIQRHISMVALKHGVIYQVKYKRRASKSKWTEREYSVQYDADVPHKHVKMFCNTNQFPALKIFVPHKNHIASEGWVRITICDLIQN